MIKRSKLSISIHDVQFAKDFQYIISVNYQSSQKSTDISALTSHPIFLQNTLIFDLPSNHTLTGQIIFVCSILIESNGKQNKRVLGECALDLTPFGLQPTETYNLPIRQQMKFVRAKEGGEVTVGKFIASFKIVQEEDIPVYLQQLQTKKIQRNEYFVQLPDFDSSLGFLWRIRLQIRQALNIPTQQSLSPQVFVQTGWTQFKDTLPQQSRIYSSSILNSNNPEWNQTFLICNPEHIKAKKGFVYVALKDNHHFDDVFRFYVPLESMVEFKPYNIKVIREVDGGKDIVPIQMFFSIILEAPYNQKDKLHDIIINDITFQPLIAPFKCFNLVLVPQSQNQPSLSFYPFIIKNDQISRILQFDQCPQFSYIMSQQMRLPPIKSTIYNAASILTISQNMLRKSISLYIVGKVDRKYRVGGVVQNIQKDLVNLLVEKVKKRLFLPIRNHPTIKMGRCQIQISNKQDQQQSQQSIASSRVSRRGEQTASQKLMKDLNISSDQGLFKHVSQNNQIIARMLRQLDDKSQSLRQAAAQISSLRNKVKLLQNQNSILKRNSLKQQDELINLVQREVQNMSNRDLKQKIAKISHLYKSQKLRSQQLDRALKLLQPQVSNSMQLQSTITIHKNTIITLEQKLQKYKKQFQRITIYKQTIKKQQKVIVKLESVMKDGMQQVRQARKVKLELEEMKKKPANINTNNRSEQKEQIQRLQRIVKELQMQQSAKINTSTYSNKDQSNYQIQFKLHQAEMRVQSLQEQLQEKSRSYARQLAMFKMKLAQKQAVFNGYQPY